MAYIPDITEEIDTEAYTVIPDNFNNINSNGLICDTCGAIFEYGEHHDYYCGHIHCPIAVITDTIHIF